MGQVGVGRWRSWGDYLGFQLIVEDPATDVCSIPGPGFGDRQRGAQKGETCWPPAAGRSPPSAQVAPLSLGTTWSVRVELCSILSGSSLCVFLLPKLSWMSDREFLLPQGGLGAGPHVFSASGPREGLWGA